MTVLEVPEVCPARKAITDAMASLDPVAWWAVLEQLAREAEQVSQARVAAPEFPAQEDFPAFQDTLVPKVHLAALELVVSKVLKVILERLVISVSLDRRARKALQVSQG